MATDKQYDETEMHTNYPTCLYDLTILKIIYSTNGRSPVKE